MRIPSSEVLDDKIQEASFFLELSKEAKGSEFRYYLSAFLGAMYAVDNLLRKDDHGFETLTNSDADKRLHHDLMQNRHAMVHLEKDITEDVWGRWAEADDEPHPLIWGEKVFASDEMAETANRIVWENFRLEYYFNGYFEQLGHHISAEYGRGNAVTDISAVYLDRMSECVSDWKKTRQ